MIFLLLVCILAPAALGFCLAYFAAAAFAALIVIAGLAVAAGVGGVAMAAKEPSNGTSGPLGMAIVSAMFAAAGIMLGLGALLGRALS